MTRFVAELGSNHNGSIDRAIDLIQAAAVAGCWGVKVQLFTADRLYRDETERAQVRPRELPVAWLPVLAEEAHRRQLAFGCTVFDPVGVAAAHLRVDFLKIASYSLLDLGLCARIGATGRPVMVGTGMARLNEVRAVDDILHRAGAQDVTFLHCVSQYPVRAADCNLSAIGTLQQCGFPKVGWSDHSVDGGVILRAALRFDADPIEVHLDLDGDGWEGEGHCWLPGALTAVIGMVHASAVADGQGSKCPQACETSELRWRADPIDGLRPRMGV